MVIHLVDGTYELFRHFYGRRSGGKLDGQPLGAAAGVLHTVLQMIETGTTHVGVATDHVIESFRNDLWPGYKTGAGVDPALRAQFVPLEEALVDLGVRVWPMVELEADDALAAAARIADADEDVQQVCIWTPDKDLAQCVRGDRVVQVDRRNSTVRNAAGVREKFGVDPVRIPDFLALVGDSADGYPGIPGIGKVGAARLVNAHGGLEDFPQRSSASGASWRCCSRISPRCELRPRSSATSRSCAGAARLRRSPRVRRPSATGACSSARGWPPVAEHACPTAVRQGTECSAGVQRCPGPRLER